MSQTSVTLTKALCESSDVQENLKDSTIILSNEGVAKGQAAQMLLDKNDQSDSEDDEEEEEWEECVKKMIDILNNAPSNYNV